MRFFIPAMSTAAAMALAISLSPFVLGAVKPEGASASPNAPMKKRIVAMPDPAVARYAIRDDREPKLSRSRKIALLRKRIKYVFVIYQENRSFDSYFGTFPGAEGIYSHPASKTPGFYQPILDVDGAMRTIHPFRIGSKEFSSDTDDVDHSHSGIVKKMDFIEGAPKMDRFALTEERIHQADPAKSPTLQAKQFGELSMAYMDGDTIPLLWRYANRFALFDHLFQLMTGPSTPGNLSILGAQTGQTQWMRHPDQAVQGNGDVSVGVPVLNDSLPFWGSSLDLMKNVPLPFMAPLSGGKRKTIYVIQRNLTYATLPLTLAGGAAEAKVSDDPRKEDIEDIREDLADLHASGGESIPWGWYQEGYDREPIDSDDDGPADAAGLHASYITHHNGPQYFGYIANSREMSDSLHGMGDFFSALRDRTLPKAGGVFYVKGGYRNLMKLKPLDPDPDVQKNFLGDDDHPAYSDAQISEAHVARTVNAIADSPYWNQCAIVITWDDSEGDYDHVQPPARSVGPDGSVIADGPRVPLLLISPYARAHAVVHEPGDHASVVKFVDLVFHLKPLADLPDEIEGREIGEKRGLPNQGPYDDRVPNVTDLLSAFDSCRLTGKAKPLPASYARIPDKLVFTLPQKAGCGWRQIGVVPVDISLGIRNEIPDDFNPRPKTNPTPAR